MAASFCFRPRLRVTANGTDARVQTWSNDWKENAVACDMLGLWHFPIVRGHSPPRVVVNTIIQQWVIPKEVPACVFDVVANCFC